MLSIRDQLTAAVHAFRPRGTPYLVYFRSLSRHCWTKKGYLTRHMNFREQFPNYSSSIPRPHRHAEHGMWHSAHGSIVQSTAEKPRFLFWRRGAVRIIFLEPYGALCGVPFDFSWTLYGSLRGVPFGWTITRPGWSADQGSPPEQTIFRVKEKRQQSAKPKVLENICFRARLLPLF